MNRLKNLFLLLPQDQHSLSAVLEAWKDGISNQFLLAIKKPIQNISIANGMISLIRIIHEPDTDMAVEMAVK